MAPVDLSAPGGTLPNPGAPTPVLAAPTPVLAAPEPENCPGPDSEAAGKMDACAGCPNQTICATAPKGPDPDVPLITASLSTIPHKLLILSGKGGVGKSTFTTMLAWALSRNPNTSIGVCDIDITGPSIPRMLGCDPAETIHTSSSGWSPVYVADNLAVMSIQFMLPSADDAVIWRGAKKSGLIKQFLRDVEWGDAEWLLVDTPPGTGDEHLAIHSYMGDAGAIIITTPQEVSLLDARKELDFCRKAGIKVWGVVENMSGFVCPGCKGESQIFRATTGGGEALAKECGVGWLGRVPLDPRIGLAGDYGESFFDAYPDSPACRELEGVVRRLRGAMGLPEEKGSEE